MTGQKKQLVISPRGRCIKAVISADATRSDGQRIALAKYSVVASWIVRWEVVNGHPIWRALTPKETLALTDVVWAEPAPL